MAHKLSARSLKFMLAWLGVFLFRLFPFRAPNVEPMLATMMPLSKRFGAFESFAFGFLGIVLYDAVTSGWGVWTAVTALCYGLTGVAARWYFKGRAASRANFVGFGVVATLIYDAATGLTIGPIFDHQPFLEALMGQVPFTALHLLGTVLFALVLSPLVYRYLVENEALEPKMQYTLA